MDTITIRAVEVRRLAKRQLPALKRRSASTYEVGFFERLLVATMAEVEAVSSAIPPLSGDSPFRFHLTAAAAMFAMERGMEGMGLTREESLRRMKEMGESYYLGMPRVMGAIARRKLFSISFQGGMAAYARSSSGRQPAEGDWLFEIRPGDGRADPLLMDFSRCGIKVLAERLGRPDLCPPMCSFDHAMARSFGYGMTRSGTLGEGRPSCDFSYTRKAAGRAGS
jgi:hypothetical protein